MQTDAQSSPVPNRRTRLRLGEERSRVKRMPVRAAVNALASLHKRESSAIRFLVDVMDTALEDENVRWCGEFLDALDVTTLTDGVALSPLIATFIARAALPDERIRYAARVRALLAQRGWSEAELVRGVDGLLPPAT